MLPSAKSGFETGAKTLGKAASRQEETLGRARKVDLARTCREHRRPLREG